MLGDYVGVTTGKGVVLVGIVLGGSFGIEATIVVDEGGVGGAVEFVD